MTLAVAGLAIAAIFLSSSAGLLSRFYDREREYRLAAESTIEMMRARLERDSTIAIADTGMTQLLAGATVPTASGGTISGVRVNLYASVTGDTGATGIPMLTLIAAAYDAGGTRHVRRVDLRRESFASYELFADSVPASVSFGPGDVNGRVHTNGTWRSASGGSAPAYHDSVTAVTAISGGGTFDIAGVTGVPRIRWPRDSTYAGLATLAAGGNLSFVPVAEVGAGYRTGSRISFQMIDVDLDTRADVDEAFAKVFDLWSGQDTSRIKVGLDPNTNYFFYNGRAWNDREVQNQCGAFYYRNSRWSFFPISTHRANWARNVIQATGGSNFPSVSSTTMDYMDDYDFNAVTEILQQPTARCFPAGSSYLMPAERMTNSSGVVTSSAADTVPFGVVTPPGGWPVSAPNGYGGSDTTFTYRSRTCTFSTGGTSGRCNSGTIATLGMWRAFPGAAATGIPTSVRQAVEVPYLWPLDRSRNPGSRGVMYANGGPVFISGSVRGNFTLVVNGPVFLIDPLVESQDADAAQDACSDRIGIIAVGDILVADNALTRGRRIGGTIFTLMARHLGGNREIRLDANVMSLTGTVGVENPGTVGVVPQSCPHDASANYSGGCFRIRGSAAMRTLTNLSSASNAGFRYAGSTNTCRTTQRRPPYFPLTNRYTFVRALEVNAAQANTPTKIRAMLLRLKGRAL